MKTLTVGSIISEGGREGRVRALDEAFSLNLAVGNGAATSHLTPEHLFAAAYAAGFHDALKTAADRVGAAIDGSTVTAQAHLKQDFQGRQELSVDLRVRMPKMRRFDAEQLLDQANEMCPYAKATRGNIRVDFWLD